MALTPGVALPAPLLTGRGEDDVRDGYQGHHGTCCEDSGGLIDDVGYGSAAQLSDDGGQIPSVATTTMPTVSHAPFSRKVMLSSLRAIS